MALMAIDGPKICVYLFKNWALVSEPGFWDFQIFEIICVRKILLANLVMSYRGKKNKGVLDRPWAKRMVLMAISSTLKFQFAVNPES